MSDDSGHKKYSPSGAKRWMNCLGYLNLVQGLPSEPDTEASMTGTAAHELAASCLTMGNNTAVYKHKVYKFSGPNGAGEYIVPAANLNLEGVQAYVDYCRKVSEGATEIGVEKKLDGSFIDPEIGGTADFVAAFVLDKLVVGDYKNGRVVVEAEDNHQMKIYAIIELGPDNPFMVETVETFIFQPNVSSGSTLKTASYAVEELYRWRDEVLIPAIEATKDPNAPLVPGEWCKWCRFQTKGNCPAILESMFGKQEERVPKTAVREVTAQASKVIAELTAEELDTALKWAEIYQPMIAAWQAEAFNRLLTKSPNAPANYKLVQGRGSRSWAKEEKEVIATLKPHVPEKLLYESKLKSVAAMEKVVKNLGLKPELLEGLVEKKFGTTMAPLSDKRKAYEPETAESMFD